MAMSKILIVEDEIELAEQLRRSLAREQHLVEVVHDGQAALDYLRVSQYDLLVLDWMMPKMTGVEVCRWQRSRGDKTPILMLTARADIEDKESGLDAGADDYLTKPFHLRELMARVRALLRRGVSPTNELRVEDLVLDPTARSLHRGGTEIKLEPKEFNLLEFLMRHPNQAFKAEALVARVWEAESEISPDAIRVYIRGLRKKIDVDGKPSIIATVHGSGYRLDAS
jgi:two-component system, OmpR family, manganese sensing response regulator